MADDTGAPQNPHQAGSPAAMVFDLEQWTRTEIAALRSHAGLPFASEAEKIAAEAAQTAESVVPALANLTPEQVAAVKAALGL